MPTEGNVTDKARLASNRNLAIMTVLICLFFVVLIVPTTSSAQLQNILPNRPAGLPAQFQNITSIIDFLFSFIITIAGTIFIILLLIGGIQYLTAAGNEEGTTKAKKLMIDAIIGLILTLAAWAIGTFILRQVGLSQGGSTIGSLSGATGPTNRPPVSGDSSNGPLPGPTGPTDRSPVSGDSINVQITFRVIGPSPGNVPLAGAEIAVDGVTLGSTLSNGLRTLGIETGNHTITVLHSNYDPAQANLTFTPTGGRYVGCILTNVAGQSSSCQFITL